MAFHVGAKRAAAVTKGVRLDLQRFKLRPQEVLSFLSGPPLLVKMHKVKRTAEVLHLETGVHALVHL